MNRNPVSRTAAMFAGAAVLFGLQQGFDMSLYLALPGGLLAYIATLVVMNMILRQNAK